MKPLPAKILLNDTRLNLLIGSGASRPHFSVLKNIERAFTLADGLDSPEKVRYARMLCAKRYVDDVVGPELFVASKSLLDKDSKCYTTMMGYENLFGVLSDLVAIRETPVTSKTINVFTTNYDTCMEHALEDLGILYNDGFVGHMNPRFDLASYGISHRRQSLQYEFVSEIPSFNLYKVHGSLNWALSNGIIELDATRQLAFECCRFAQGISESEKPDVNDLGAFQRHLESTDDFSLTLEQEQFLDSYEKLVVVSPTKKKFEETLVDRNYYEMLRMMSNELEKENALLFVIGFSFADEHIREIVARALSQNPTLTVVVFSYSDAGARQIEDYEEFCRLPYSNLQVINPAGLEVEYVDIAAVTDYLSKALPRHESSLEKGTETDA